MTFSTSDSNLLYGILALQLDFISRDELVAAMNAWVLRKAVPIGKVLLEQKAVTPEVHELLEALVEKHVEQHGNDPQRSLQAVSSIKSVRADLSQIADLEFQKSLCQIEAASDSDPLATLMRHENDDASIRYRVLRPHARGGLGEVFLARDLELDREVALKEIQLDKSHHAESRLRFLLEAKITGYLEHPGIVPVYGLGHYGDGRPFYAMRFIRGDSLEQAVAKVHDGWQQSANGATTTKRSIPASAFASLEFRHLLRRFVDVCNAIEYAHARGVLHRDLKPGNVMLGKYGETLVVDWGLAKLRRDIESHSLGVEPIIATSAESGSTSTQMGTVVGTPAYMSPEQAAGKLDLLGPASDVYSLGASLYHILTGEAPFEKQDLGVLLRRIQEADFKRPTEVLPTVPRTIEAICLRAMSVHQADRYHSPKALAEDVERWLADQPVSAIPDTTMMRCGRWMRHHRQLIAGLMLLGCSIVISLFVIAFLLHDANRRISKERDVAQRNAQLAKQAQARAERGQHDKEIALEAAEHSAANARAREFAARAVAYLESGGDPQLALGWAIASIREQRPPLDDSITALYGSVQSNRLRSEFVAPNTESWIWNPRKSLLVLTGGETTLWDPSVNERVSLSHTISKLSAWSPDGMRLLVCEQISRVFDIHGKQLATIDDQLSSHTNWSPNSQFFAAHTVDEKALLVYDSNGVPVAKYEKRPYCALESSWSSDGSRLVILWAEKPDEDGRSEKSTIQVVEANGKLIAEMELNELVWSVDWVPNQPWLCLKSLEDENDRISFWTIATGTYQRLSVLDQDSQIVWSPLGTSFVRLLDAQRWQLQSSEGRQLTPAVQEEAEIYEVKWSPTGDMFIVLTGEATLDLWSSTGERIAALEPPDWEGASMSPTFFRNSGGLFSVQDEPLSEEPSSEDTSFGEYSSAVDAVEWSPNGKAFCWLSQHRSWLRSRDGAPLLRLGNSDHPVRDLVWSPQGGKVAVILDGIPRMFLFTDEGESIGQLHLESQEIQWSYDETLIAARSDRGLKVFGLDPVGGQALTGHTQPVTFALWQPGGHLLATASTKTGERFPLLLRNVQNNDRIRVALLPTPVVMAQWRPDGKLLAVLQQSDELNPAFRNRTPSVSTLSLVSVDGQILRSIDCRLFDWSPEGDMIAIAGLDDSLTFGEGLNPTRLKVSNVGPIIDMSWDKTGAYLGCIHAEPSTIAEARPESHSARILSVFNRKGECLYQKTSPPGVERWVWSNSGKHFVVMQPGAASIWARDVTKLSDLVDARHLVWHPTADRLALVDSNNAVHVWDDAGQSVLLCRLNQEIHDVQWDPTGNIIAIGTSGGEVHLCTTNAKAHIALLGHEKEVVGLRWNQHGTLLASLSTDGSVRLWSKTGKPIATLTREDWKRFPLALRAPVRGGIFGGRPQKYPLSWSEDGKFLAAGFGDYEAHLWTTDFRAVFQDALQMLIEPHAIVRPERIKPVWNPETFEADGWFEESSRVVPSEL